MSRHSQESLANRYLVRDPGNFYGARRRTLRTGQFSPCGQSLFRLALAVVATVLLSACAAPEPQPLIFGAPVWQSGEASEYEIVDSQGQYIGTMTYHIYNHRTDTGEADADGWQIRREISAQGQQEIALVEVTHQNYRPQHSDLVRMSAQGQEQVETIYNGGRVDIALTNHLGNTIFERVNTPSDIRDERTVPIILRTLPLKSGYTTRLNSFLPITGQVERVTVQVSKSERVSVPAGTYDTWLVELKTTTYTNRAWIGREAPYLLVKFADSQSKASFELAAYSEGSE
jgi:hypothetical protein